LDSDDEWRPEKLERQLAAATALGCKASCSNALRCVPGRDNTGNLHEWNERGVTLRHLFTVNQVICSSVLIHRSLIDVIEGFPEDAKLRALEDYALWLRVAALTDFAYVNEPLVVYRDDPVSSVRAEGVHASEQKRRVLKDFFFWAAKRRTAKLPQYLAGAAISIGQSYFKLMRRKFLSAGGRLREGLRRGSG